MKIRLPQSLRLFLANSAPVTACLGLFVLSLGASVSAATHVLTGAGDVNTFYSEGYEPEDILDVDINGGYAGAGTRNVTLDKIIIRRYTVNNGGSHSLEPTINADFVSPDSLTGDQDGDIRLAGDTGKWIINGDQSAFSGDFIKTDDYEWEIDFKNTDATLEVFNNVSGTGAISNAPGVISYLFTNNVTIGNTSITAATVNLTSDGADGASTTGADYTISSALTVGTLALYDESTANLTAAGVSITTLTYASANNVVTLSGDNASISTIEMGNTAAVLNINQSATIGMLNMSSTGASVTIDSVGVGIAGVSFGYATNILTVNAGAELTISGSYVFTQAGQIVNNGTIIFGNDATIDVSALDWSVSGSEYTLDLFGGTGGTYTNFDNLAFVGDGLTGRNLTFNSDGIVSYSVSSVTYNTVGGEPFDWTASTEGVFDNTFTSGADVIFAQSATATITENILSPSVTINAGTTLTLSASGSNTLTAGTIDLTGNLILNSTALGTGTGLSFEGGSLSLANGVTQTVASVSSTANSMTLNGEGTLIVDGALLSGGSTTTIGAGATLQINERSNDASARNIRGSGTLAFAGNGGTTYLNVDGFTGAVNLLEGASGLRFRINQASGSRFALTTDSATGITIGLHGVAGPGTNGLLLNELSGNINVQSQGSNVNSYERTHIDLEMTEDNRWTGTWEANDTEDGFLIVGSAGDSSHTFTITQGLNATAHNGDWNKLQIDNATVRLEEAGEWRGNIEFTQDTSKLVFAGDSVNLVSTTTAHLSNPAVFTSDVAGAGIIEIATAADKTITVSRTNNGGSTDAPAYSGSILVSSGTLALSVANAFLHAEDVRITDGTIDMMHTAQANAITIAGNGSILGASAWTGDLTVESGNATLNGKGITGTVNVETGASLTLGGTTQLTSAITAVDGATLTLGGTIVMTETYAPTTGTISFDANVIFDINAFSESAWVSSGNTNTLKLFNFTSNSAFAGLSESNLSYTAGEGRGIIFNDDGSISYTLAPLVYTGSELSWANAGTIFDDEAVFDTGNAVIFRSTADVTLAESISSTQVEIESGHTITLSSEVGESNQLNSRDIQVQGTLKLMGDVLHDSSIVRLDGGTLSFGENSDLSSSQVTVLAGSSSDFNFNVDAGKTVSITGQLSGSTALNLTGTGTLNLSGSLLEGVSTTTIAEGATLIIGTGSGSADIKNITDVKNIRGAGTLEFGGSDGVTSLNVNGFTGAIKLLDTAAGVRFNANYAEGSRFDLIGSSTATTVDLLSPHGNGNVNSGLLLNNLSGNINFDSAGTTDTVVTAYTRTYIDLEMTQDNVWTGTWDSGQNDDGYLVVGSSGVEHHKFTITKGLTGNPQHDDWNRLEIQNATVAFADSGKWNADIEFTTAESELQFTGNSQELTVGIFKSKENTGNSGKILIDTKDDSNVITVSRTNDAYKGSVSVASGTLQFNVNNAFAAASSVNVSGGVLDMTGKVQANTVTMTGGKLINTSAWTGNLAVNQAEGAAESSVSTVTDSDLSAKTITIQDQATLRLENSILSATGTLINDGSVAAGTLELVNSTIRFAESQVVMTAPLARSASAESDVTRALVETSLDLDSMLKVEFDTAWNISEMVVKETLYLELNITEAQFDLFHDYVLATGVAFAFDESAEALDLTNVDQVYIGLKSADHYELHQAQSYDPQIGGVQYALLVSVPEPSSATLSLLALTALLARRRRPKA